MSEKTFTKDLSFRKLFIFFVIGSVFGAYYEQILNFLKAFLFHGKIFWELRRGVIYGPISPVYGFGLVLIILILCRKELPKWKVFLYGAILGGVLEFGISFLQETFIGTVSWDYSNKSLNIGGRTTIPFMLFWGVLGYIVVYYIYPFISKLIEKIPYKKGIIITNVLIILVTLDMLISWTALFRQTLRRNNIKPVTPIGRLYDRIYPDEFLIKYYPNMKVGK